MDKCTHSPTSQRRHTEIQTANRGPSSTEEFGLPGGQCLGGYHEVAVGVLGHKSGLRGRRPTRRAQTSHLEVKPTHRVYVDLTECLVNALAG